MRSPAALIAIAILAIGLASPPAAVSARGSETSSVWEPGATATLTAAEEFPKWILTGDMPAGRRDHMATLLPTGKVLVIGGTAGGALLFDPDTGLFAPTGPALPGPTQGTTATRLLDGRVLVVSEMGAQLYDPASGSFRATGSPNQPRTHAAATLLRDGKVLFAGGQIGSPQDELASAEIYDPATERFSFTGALNTGRSAARSTLLPNGKVLVFGGTIITSPGWGLSTDTAELYDPASGLFAPTGSMHAARGSIWWTEAPVLPNGKVLIVGGGEFAPELYDPSTGTFSTTGRMVTPRSVPTATLLQDGRVLVAGGWRNVDSLSVDITTAEIYDAGTGSFTNTASLNAGRLQHAATLLSDGRVLVTGGFSAALGRDIASSETFALSAPAPSASSLNLRFGDPVGDHTGPIDVTEMLMTFDVSTGSYELLLTATAEAPFQGRFRINVNLWNPTRSSVFSSVGHDFDLSIGQTAMRVTGVSGALRAWRAGDRVATNTLALGNPPSASFFRSGVSTPPFTFLTNEDAIAYGPGGSAVIYAGPTPPPNTAPTANAGGPYALNEGGSATLSGSGTDADGDALSLAWDLDDNRSFERLGQTVPFVATGIDGPATRTVRLQACDGQGLCATASAIVEIRNAAPSAILKTVLPPIVEGMSIPVELSDAKDPSPADVAAGFRYAFSCDGQPLAGATYASSGATASTACEFVDNGTFTIRGRIIDKDDGFTERTVTVAVDNAAPVVDAISAPADPIRVGAVITASALFTDAGRADTHTTSWDWGDGTTSAGSIDRTSGLNNAIADHIYTSPGVHTIALTVTDKDGGIATATYQYVVVYSPDAGYVTGSGWIDSPIGAYRPDPSLGGRATFGFVARYLPGRTTPDGTTEFQFRTGNLNFHSDVQDWLVVAGPRAQYRGVGTINGAGFYSFMLTAIDGTRSNADDRFRIRIWGDTGVVYDNQHGDDENGDPTTSLGGGSIVIHRP